VSYVTYVFMCDTVLGCVWRYIFCWSSFICTEFWRVCSFFLTCVLPSLLDANYTTFARREKPAIPLPYVWAGHLHLQLLISDAFPFSSSDSQQQPSGSWQWCEVNMFCACATL